MDTIKNSEESELQIHNTVTDFTGEGQGEQQAVTCLDEPQSEKLSQVASEEQKAHSAEVMKQIYRQFRMVGTKFYFKDQPDKVAFEVKGQRVVSKFSDERVAKAMVTLSEAKGWKTIKISGDREFCRAVWLEASTRGIKSRGYKPTEQDLSDLETLSEKQSKNHIDKGLDETQASRDTVPEIKKQHTSSDVYRGEILSHGAAPYKHEPKNKDSYFVKLSTEQGEKVIWGVDLKRAMSERNVQKGDRVTLEFKGNKAVTVEQPKYDEQGKFLGKEMIDTHRNEWEFQKIGSQEKTAQSVPDVTDTSSPKSTPSINNQKLDTNTRVGHLLDHGKAPYQHDSKNEDSYFVKLATEQGEKVLWGVDLERAMSKRNVQKGDRVTLEFKGNKAVTVERSKYDEQGKFLGKEMIDTHRNEWEFQKIGSQEKTAQSLPDITGTSSPKSTPSINKQNLDMSTRVGRLLDHGKAPYQHDSKNEASYFVKLATEQGEKVIWGIDLERAINSSNAQKGDRVTLDFEGKKSVTIEQSKYDEQGKFLAKETIQAHKNEWKIQKNEQYKVVEAVADHLINSKIVDIEKRKILKAAVDSRLRKLAESGKMPTIRIYDKNAPIRSSQQTQGQAVVERNTERTR